MSRVGRLAGALLAETQGAFYLVGNLKRPCDFAAAGFESPAVPVDALARPFVPLRRSGPLAVPGPWIGLRVEGEALPRLLAERLLIARNGSVSDRLWRLILGTDEDAESGDGLAAQTSPCPSPPGGEGTWEKGPLEKANFAIDTATRGRTGRAADSANDTATDGRTDPVLDAAWLGEVPARVWAIVRDTVLRCT